MGRPEPVESADSKAHDACPAGPAKPMRADARRNYENLLRAAHEEFTERGAAASLEEVARRAGVGVGTLYRHFPNRQALLEAVYVEEVQSLCASAGQFADADPWAALSGWLHRFIGYMATKRALVEEMMGTMSKDAPVFRTCHDAIFSAGEPLLEQAKSAGVVRADVQFADIISLVAGVTLLRNSTPEQMERVLGVALDGLRYGAADASGRSR